LTFINSEGVCCLTDPCPCSKLARGLGDAFEFHLSGHAYVERHEDRGSGSRARGPTYFLALSLRWVTAPRRALESLGAIRGDRRLVGDPDDETFLAVQKLGFYIKESWVGAAGSRVIGAASPPLRIFRHTPLADDQGCTKGLDRIEVWSFPIHRFNSSSLPASASKD
jgi:hypothetical protein